MVAKYVKRYTIQIKVVWILSEVSLKMTFNVVMSLTFSPKIPVSNRALQGISLVIR